MDEMGRVTIGTVLAWEIPVFAGYLIGCLNMAWFLAQLQGKDIFSMGNGNPGASNAAMSMGPWVGVVTAVWDIGKAVLAWWAAGFIPGATDVARLLAAGAAVLGHVFPFCFNFRGGKGFAPFIGFMLCADPGTAVLSLVLGSVLALSFDKIVAMTFLCITLEPVHLFFAAGDRAGAAMALVLSCVLLWRHRENISRLKAGTEPGIMAALAGKYRGRSSDKIRKEKHTDHHDMDI